VDMAAISLFTGDVFTSS